MMTRHKTTRRGTAKAQFTPRLSGLFGRNFVLLFLYTQGFTEHQNVISHGPVFPFSLVSDSICSLLWWLSLTMTFYTVSTANFLSLRWTRSTVERKHVNNWFIHLVSSLVTEHMLHTHDRNAESEKNASHKCLPNVCETSSPLEQYGHSQRSHCNFQQ